MNQSKPVFTAQQIHAIGCRCRSCLTMSALKRTGVVLAILSVCWVTTFAAMGWEPTRFF